MPIIQPTDFLNIDLLKFNLILNIKKHLKTPVLLVFLYFCKSKNFNINNLEKED